MTPPRRGREARPPRIACALLRVVIPRRWMDGLLGDLAEEYAVVHGAQGRLRADVWYWGQALRSLPPSLLRRLRSRPTDPSSRGEAPVDAFLHDLRHTLRGLARNPVFALVVVGTLATGIGANTLIYGIVDGVVLNPFPFPRPEALVGIGSAHPRSGTDLGFFENLSPAEFVDVREQSRTLERVVAWDMGNREIAGEGGAPERVFTAFWWGNAFPTLGVEPTLGRGFSDREIEEGAAVAVISHRLWQGHFGSDPGVVGRTLLVNGHPHVLVGVMPPRTLIYGTDLWTPMSVTPDQFPRDRRQFQVLARLAPGATLTEANTELEGLARRVEAAWGAGFPEYAGWHLEAQTWNAINVRNLRPAALILLGAVGFVLLLVCANVASLLLARSTARAREIAVRMALGARRGRLLRQLLTESVILALLGGAAGTGLAVLGIRGWSRVIDALPVPVPGDVSLNARILAFTAAVSVLAGILFGLAPAWNAVARPLQGTLRDEGHGSTGSRGRLRLQRVFVAVEVALALVLLAGGALLVQSLLRLQAVDPGVDPDRVLTMRLTLPWERYDRQDIPPFFQELLGEIEGLPGVRSAAATAQFPPRVFLRNEIRIDGRPPGPDGDLPAAYTTIVTPGYFETLGIPVLRGRTLGAADRRDAPFVAVVNDAAARRFFDGDPVGQRVSVGGEGPWFEVVGVVADTRNRGLDAAPEPELFATLSQAGGFTNQLFLTIRTEVEPMSVLPAVRAAVRSLDPQQPVYAIQTLDQAFALASAQRSIAATALTVFALFALLLAAVGIYGVVAFTVGRRTREIGVRIAMGAERGHIRRLMVRQALVPAGLGAVAGLALALAAGRALSVLLFEVEPTDPWTLAGVTALLIGVAVAASWIPARRASRLDPVDALRAE